jgi:serine/threonine-protein kinase
MTQPPCDDSYITIVASAVVPSLYPKTVGDALAQYSDSQYLLTKTTCPSLRAQYVDGSDIYVVYFGPYFSREEACDARVRGPPDAYVKQLSSDLPGDHEVSCS